MDHLLDQLYKTKLRLAGLVTALFGVGFLFLSHTAATVPTLRWLVAWPTSELGTTLLSAGVVAVIFEYYARREADERATAHFRRAIRQEAPAIRDAVLHSFAFNPDTLKNIASNETLDRIAANAIGLRLGDQALALEAYADLREQVIRSPERWRDVEANVSLSPWDGGPAAGSGSMFVATIRWEYRVKPASTVMRFACVSDQTEYRDLLRDPTTNSVWYFEPHGRIGAQSRDAFELVQFTVNGVERAIRRTERRGAQHYTVVLGKEAAGSDELVIAHTYRVLIQRHSHLLYLDLPRPAKDFHVQFGYGHAGIKYVNVLDYFASPEAARIQRSPASTPAKMIDVSFDGQIFPRAGVAFVWVLEAELS
ncbi:hypothetical protein [Amycolatopsis samaneae]|uniref:Uncharacterized protein n=1 Tax=Amycolatopsis samaneae TaxID=664691 RepID=A0ABW5GI83_9PSEU